MFLTFPNCTLEEFRLKKFWKIQDFGIWLHGAEIGGSLEDESFSSLHLKLVIEKTGTETASIRLHIQGAASVSIASFDLTLQSMEREFENAEDRLTPNLRFWGTPGSNVKIRNGKYKKFLVVISYMNYNK